MSIVRLTRPRPKSRSKSFSKPGSTRTHLRSRTNSRASLWNVLLTVAFCVSLLMFLGALAGIGNYDGEDDRVQEVYVSESNLANENALQTLPVDNQATSTTVSSYSTNKANTYPPEHNTHLKEDQPKDIWRSAFFPDPANQHFDDSFYSPDFNRDFDVGLDDSGRTFALRVHLPIDEFDMQYDTPYAAYNRRRKQREREVPLGYGKVF